MANRIVRIKNASGSGGTWCGATIAADEYINLTDDDIACMKNSNVMFTAIGAGDIIVNKGADTVDDIADVTEAWNWLIGETMPYSRHLEGKLAVHSSSKPEPPGSATYAVWAGAGDDITQAEAADSIGTGDLLVFNMNYDAGFAGPGTNIVTKDVKFDPRHGRVWIHEAYLKFENGGLPDYLTSDIMAPATPLQQAVNLDLVVDGDGWVTFAPGGVGTGTHGFGGNPSLLPRTYSQDGDWDWDGANLTPNLTQTGGYRINSNEMSVHRYFNKIPLYGSSTTYFTMSSEETAELPVNLGYFIRIKVYNDSNSDWKLSAIIEIYRERTVDP